jgi:hypothetical protein
MGDATDPSANGEGHNSKKVLTQEEKNALLVHWVAKLRADKAAVTAAHAPYKEAQDNFTATVNAAKAELGKRFTRKRLVGLLEDATARLRDILREEEERFQDRVALGLPIYGHQQDLFGAGDETPQEAKDAIGWEAEGYLLGRRGADPDIKDMPARFKTDLMKGWHRGQEENGRLMEIAAAANRGEPKADPPVDLNPGPDPTDEKAIKAAAKKLKEQGFDKKSAPALEPVH